MGSGGSPGSPARGHVSLPEGLRWLAREPLPGTHVSPGWAPVARPGAPPGGTCLSRKCSGGSPGSPCRGHVALSEGLRWAHSGAPPEDTRLTRKRKENKRKGKSYYRWFFK